MADFAKAQLLKYGWTEGKGLGKNESGIAEAIKPKLKFDTAGFGHKSDYTNQWWEACYEKALKNITLESGSPVIDSSEVRTQNQRKNEEESRVLAGRFLKSSSVVQNGILTCAKSKSDSSEDESPGKLVSLTDEELFKACGGRTAHKGARHGLKLSGKLRRIEEQEKAFLETSSLHTEKSENSMSERKRKRGRREIYHREFDKKMKYELELPDETTVVEPLELSGCDECCSSTSNKSKVSRRKDRRKINDLSHKFDSICKIEAPALRLLLEERNQEEEEEQVKSSSRKDKKKKRSLGSGEPGTLARKKRMEPRQDREEEEEEEEEQQRKGRAKDESLADSEESGFHEEMERLYTELKEDVREKVAKLNSRILKKKYKKIRRKEKAKLELLSRGLMAVHLNNESEKGTKVAKEKEIGDREGERGAKETKKLENIVRDLKAVNLEEAEQEWEKGNDGESIVKFVKAPKKKSSKSSKGESRKGRKAK